MGLKNYLDACGIEFDPELETLKLWELAHKGKVMENPWPAVTIARNFELDLWTETTETEYWRYLEVLPPVVVGPFWFQNSEPSNHTAQGVPIYGGIAAIKYGDTTRYFARDSTIAQFKLQALMLASSYKA